MNNNICIPKTVYTYKCHKQIYKGFLKKKEHKIRKKGPLSFSNVLYVHFIFKNNSKQYFGHKLYKKKTQLEFWV